MKKSDETIGIILVLLATVGVIASLFYGKDTSYTDIVARAPEKGNFSPRVVKVPFGEKVKLRIRNVDTVMHGFAIPALEVDAGEIKAGHYAILEFTPEKPGEYDFYCTVWCSEFHLQMRGLLVVSAQ